MRKFGWLFLLTLFAAPDAALAQEQAQSRDNECLAAPTYECLVAGARAAAESEPDRGAQANLFAYLAATQAAAGRREDAGDTLERAFACAPSIRIDWTRESFAALVIRAKAGMGELAEASMLAAHVETPYHSAFAYSSLARGQALNGDLRGAARSLRMAEVAADTNAGWDDGFVRAVLAISFAYAGSPDRAHELAARARELDAENVGVAWAAYGLAAAAVAEAIAGHDDDSAAYIAESRAKEAELDENGDRAKLLGYVSWAHAERGDRDAMLAAISEMAALDLDEAPARDRVHALSVAAMALGRTGRR